MKHEIIMPDLGQTAAEGKIVRWLKRPGEKVAQGDPILEVETDKVTMEVESYKAGYLRALLVNEGEMASAMAPIAILTDEPEEAYDSATPAGMEPAAETDMPLAPASASEQLISGSRTSSLPPLEAARHPAATPAARRRARKLGMAWRSLRGSGPDGLIIRRDIENAWQKQQAFGPASPMAAITAKSVAEIPHFYVTVDMEVTETLQWRARWNEAHPELRASWNDIFVRAASLALKDVPKLNVHYDEGRIKTNAAADVHLVVAVEAGLRLVSIPDPSRSSWEEYLQIMRRALDDIRQNRMTSSPLSTMPSLALSNLGMFGVKQFTAIIPPGCAAILAIGAVREEAIVRNRQLKMEDISTVTLSADHRMVDGITAARFLERFQMHLRALEQ
jgi:pyruvate dehydrogenase E2 component (dihydrolipoamide acetyltransferase)